MIKDQLKKIILEIRNHEIVSVNDDYSVQIHLKDPSVYAYAPRRFVGIERQAIRQIMDLLQRGIIKTSVSLYCARVVPVKEKNGQTRLCVDLRPLNSRVIKQEYSFPVIEECLSKLTNKKVFTLLDPKNSFYQIKVDENSTKYFSFATPDEHFEYTRSPFD